MEKSGGQPGQAVSSWEVKASGEGVQEEDVQDNRSERRELSQTSSRLTDWSLLLSHGSTDDEDWSKYTTLWYFM